MLLAINANNTNTVFAVWDGANLKGSWRAATDARRTADEYVVWLDHLLALQGLARQTIHGAIIASVVPEANFNLRRLCRDYCGREPLVVGEPGVAIGIEALVDRPEEVGADRLVNTVAAHDRYKGPLIIVDFGTATTFDVVDDEGQLPRRRDRARHQPVAPGAGARRGKAAERADRPHQDGHRHQHRRLHAVGHLLGLCRARSKGWSRASRPNSAQPMSVVSTGGLAPLFDGATAAIDRTDPTLTLWGLKLIFDRNRKP